MRIIAAAALLTLASLCASPGFAADPPKKDLTLVQGKGSGPILTKDQLRSCMTRQAALKQQDAELEKDEAALAQTKADLADSGKKLAAQLESLDHTNADAVATYNAAGAARDQQIDDFEKRADAFNSRIEARDAERASYGPSCVNRRYLEEDAAALRKEKAK